MLHGWIKLHRSILDNWVASEPESLAVWVRLLSEANHKETKKRFNGSLVTIGRGQVVFGLNAFSDKSGVSISKLRRILSELESDGMISRQITSKYSLITITCFDKYQDADSQATSNTQADSKRTTGESQHRKNVKNGKNVKIKDLFDAERIIPIWNSLGCKQHKGLTQAAEKALAKTYKEYCSSIKEPKEPKELNDWLESYLVKGFGGWMTDHHREMGDGNWSADLEFAVRFSTYDKIKNTVTQ